MIIKNWLSHIIKTEQPPENVIAYYFGLFENEDGYVLYLTGSAEFEKENSDWACNNDFEPGDKYLQLPEECNKLKWDEVQEKVIAELKNCIQDEQFKASFLSNTNIAVGFDDGDIELIQTV